MAVLPAPAPTLDSSSSALPVINPLPVAQESNEGLNELNLPVAKELSDVNNADATTTNTVSTREHAPDNAIVMTICPFCPKKFTDAEFETHLRKHIQNVARAAANQAIIVQTKMMHRAMLKAAFRSVALDAAVMGMVFQHTQPFDAAQIEIVARAALNAANRAIAAQHERELKEVNRQHYRRVLPSVVERANELQGDIRAELAWERLEDIEDARMLEWFRVLQDEALQREYACVVLQAAWEATLRQGAQRAELEREILLREQQEATARRNYARVILDAAAVATMVQAARRAELERSAEATEGEDPTWYFNTTRQEYVRGDSPLVLLEPAHSNQAVGIAEANNLKAIENLLEDCEDMGY